MQAYRGLPILTNQSPARLVGIWELEHEASVGERESPGEELRRRIAKRTQERFERGVEEEVRVALAGPMSPTARHIHGLSEISELPREEALEALVARTSRYAIYQLRWMRRIPGVVSLDALRPPGELADAILEMARSRERLPARGAGRARRSADA